MSNHVDTIIALASAPGLAGVSVLRLSGPQAFMIAGKIHSKGTDSVSQPRQLMYGEINYDDQLIDDAMIVAMPGPASYTGEDVVEFYTHGNPLIAQKVIDAALRCDARLAEPGEFTKRAYLNNRLDLVQAEAVADVIAASSEQALGLARRQLGGSWSAQLKDLERQVVALLAHVSAWLDFGEEDIADLSSKDVAEQLEPIIIQIDAWASGAPAAEIIRDGYRVALVGLPNAGKSSLLNALAGFEKAIVTDIAGTTRDTVEHQLHINGFLIELIDTAGLRDTSDKVEGIGVDRARQAASNAHAVLILVAPDQNMDDLKNELKTIDDIATRVYVGTKSDVGKKNVIPAQAGIQEAIATSAKTGKGISELRTLLGQFASQGASSESAITANTRQLSALKQARNNLEEAHTAALQDTPLDLLAVHLTAAAESLAAVTGSHISESMLDSIFSTFCIGK